MVCKHNLFWSSVVVADAGILKSQWHMCECNCRTCANWQAICCSPDVYVPPRVPACAHAHISPLGPVCSESSMPTFVLNLGKACLSDLGKAILPGMSGGRKCVGACTCSIVHVAASARAGANVIGCDCAYSYTCIAVCVVVQLVSYMCI